MKQSFVRVYILLFCLSLFQIISGRSASHAQVRDLSGIEIVSRSERGATEGRGKLFGGSWTRYLDVQNDYEAWLAGIGEDPDGAFAAKKARKDIEQKRYKFLEKNYPQDIRVIKTVREVGVDKLVRSREYAANKTKIVVHHTAGDQIYDTPAIALVGMQDIYKFHTLTRGRGDVGYNFLIDPFGTIYEGRAGGKGVVGAHTDWNNVSTIGIALMGNFDRYAPTTEARASLKKLAIALSLEYGIDPFQTNNYFTVTQEDPFISAHTDVSLVGHKDVKTTGCPGTEVYHRLPALRAEVADAVRVLQGTNAGTTITYVDHEAAVYMDDVHGLVSVPFAAGGKVSCESLSDAISLVDCTWGRTNMLDMYLAHADYPASGYQSVLVHVGKERYIITFLLVWEKELELLRQEKHQAYALRDTHPTPSPSEKITRAIPISEVSTLMKEKVHVLLYDASTNLIDREIVCSDACDLEIDNEIVRDINNFRVIQFDGGLRVFVGRETYDANTLVIKNDEFVTIENYDRIYADIPMDTFRGDLTIDKQEYKHLDKGRMTDYVLINSVSLDEYMKGVGEISEHQHVEKITLMSLLSKSYMLFYIDKTNSHPSIPEDTMYNAVDDPRIFQRYFGAGFEIYGTQWLQSLEKTKQQVVSYDGYVPILPYFHCSAGFTKSGKEFFGRTDTPWLQSKLDVATCASGGFEGHGVGLSGDGAEAMAQAGMTYQDILKWYYEGISVEEI